MLADQFELLARHLPKDVYMGSSLEYATYHAKAIAVNGENDLYTLEYFAFHILWMSFIEKVTYQLYKYDETGTRIALGNNGNDNTILARALSLYDLSVINEKKLCGIARHPIIGYHPNKVNNLRELVDKRDHVAHCSGVLDLDKDDILQLAQRCIRYTQEIQDKMARVVLERWDDFIRTLNGGDVQYSLIHDAVVDYISKEFVSVQDINTIIGKRNVQDSSKNENAFRTNLALLQIALIAEDYDTELDVTEDIKATILSHGITYDQQSQVHDEHEAYVRFRAGLAI